MSDLYDLPDGWEWKKLEDLAKFQSGGTPSRSNKKYWDNGNIHWVKISDITDDMYISKTEEFITKDGLDNSSAKLFPKGTILYTIFATIGKIGILDIEATTNQAISGLQTKDNVYLFYMYYGLKFITNEVQKVSAGAAQNNINLTKLKEQWFPLPPLPEQQRIVKKLDSLFSKIDRAIELHQKNIDESNIFMASVLNEVFEELEGKYEKIIFDKVCNKITDGSHNPPKGIEDSNYLMLSSKNVIDNAINFENPRYLKEEDFTRENKRTDVMIGDVLLTIVGTIGRTAVIETDKKFVLQRSVAVLKPKKNLLNSYFLMYSLRKNLNILVDGAKGAAQKGIYLKSVKQLEIVNTPLQIQQKVVKYLDDISTKIEKVKEIQKEKMKSLKDLKASILDKAFRGEL